MLKVLYYISVLFLSALSLLFSAAIEPRLLVATVTISLFLLFVPKLSVKGSVENEESSAVVENIAPVETKETESMKKEVAEEIVDNTEPCTVESDEDEETDSLSENIREEYIYMGIRAYTKHGISLSSQTFDSKEEAEYFADVFRNNYTSRVRVCEVVGGGYGVLADFVPERQIRSNYRRENDGYIFANWKYEHKRNLPKPPKEHFMDRHPKTSDVLICGVVTWPIFAIILLFEWLRGAAWIPNDNMVKVSHQELANMDGVEFETYVGRRLKAMGYKNVKVTQASGDFGADVIAVNLNGETVCIQCKHYSQPVGIKAIQEIYSAKQYYGCQKAMVITNSTYTQAAIDLAKSTGVDLWANFR